MKSNINRRKSCEEGERECPCPMPDSRRMLRTKVDSPILMNVVVSIDVDPKVDL